MSFKTVRHSILFRSLVILVLTIIVLMGGITAWFVHSQKVSLTESEFKSNHDIAINMANAMKQELELFDQQLSLLAKTSSIVAMDSIESSAFLKSFDVSPLFTSGESVQLYGPNNQFICDNSMVGKVYYAAESYKPFTAFEKVNPVRTYLSKWYWEDSKPKKMFALQVGSRAKANGTLAANFSFRRIWNKYPQKITDSKFLIVSDNDGNILMHPDPKIAAEGKTKVQDLGLPDPKNLLNDYSDFVRLKNGSEYLVSFANNSTYQLNVYSLQSREDVEKAIYTTVHTILILLVIVLCVTIFMINFIFMRFTTPLRKIIKYINFISEGNFDAEPFPNNNNNESEIGILARSFNSMLQLIQKQMKQLNEHKKHLEEQVLKRTKELEEAKNQLDIMSRTDELTGLPNRRDLREKIQQEAHRAVRMRRDFSFIFIDIDKFKKINDTYGHNCGDVVLKSVAATIRQLLRKYDFVARWGGEEFLVMLPETPLEGATVVAERFRKTVEDLEITYGELTIPVTITVGVALYDARLGVDRSIQLADQALYKGKENGRNQVVVWNPEDTTEEDYRAAELELQRQAMDNESQPGHQPAAPFVEKRGNRKDD